MIKRILMGLLVGFLIIVLVFLTVYVIFNSVILRSEISKVEKYKLLKNEKIVEKFTYNKYHYVITTFNEKDKDYASNNFLVKYNGKYYYLDTFTDCDMSMFAKDNNLYVHCIGYDGNIVKFRFFGTRVFNEVIEFNYIKAPNIDQKKIEVTKVTDKYIYLKSKKKDDSVKEGTKVKCSLETFMCTYTK